MEPLPPGLTLGPAAKWADVALACGMLCNAIGEPGGVVWNCGQLLDGEAPVEDLDGSLLLALAARLALRDRAEQLMSSPFPVVDGRPRYDVVALCLRLVEANFATHGYYQELVAPAVAAVVRALDGTLQGSLLRRKLDDMLGGTSLTTAMPEEVYRRIQKKEATHGEPTP